MARILIVGCGCRGQSLARALRGDGHAVRGTSRDDATLAAIEAAGAEPYRADPDRVGSLVYGFDAVTVVVWLLGSADGTPDQLDALHGPRLRMLFEKLVDTTVRGVVYEAAGTVGAQRLARGRAIAEKARDTWEIPLAFLEADPAPAGEWLIEARAAIGRLLALDSRQEFGEIG
jgi:nucleoside-diphosphate-sugar epimerase